MRRQIGVLLSALLFLLSARAQTGLTMSGVVHEQGTGNPVSGAEVSIVGGKANQDVTDSAGKFSLKFASDVRPGTVVRIRITKKGYKPYAESIPFSSELSVPVSLTKITKAKSPSNSQSLPQLPQDSILAGDMLFMDCHYGVMPNAYPASGHLNVLATSGTTGDSLADYFAPANSQARWNNTGKPEWAYRCEVTNYTKNVVVNLEMIIHATFRTPIPVIDSPNSFRQGDVTFDGDWRITAPKIDSGPESPFVFWIWNCCVDKFVQLRAPNLVTVGGSSGRRQISLTQSSGNLYQALMPNGK